MKLNIQLFATNGTINGSSTASGADYRIVWEETSRDVTNSTITIKVTPQIYRSGSSSTTGTFSGTLTINGTSYNISKKFSPYNWGSWKSIASKTVTISNASAKSVAISSSVKNTGTSMAGTYSASGTAVLDTLYEPPIISSYTITETNSALISAEIANNVFVNDLSQKSFDFDYEIVETGATASQFQVINRENVLVGTTEPITYDFTQNTMLTSLDDPTKVPIQLVVKDSNGLTAKYPVSADLYTYIAYKKPTLEETTSTTKRIGQTSGKVGVTLNGTFYNGTVGNKDQSGSYKPTITYKYWQHGTTEPATYDNTIPSSAITITNGTFKVEDYDIGSETTTDPNYFNPDYGYKFKFQITDNFTTITSSEKSVALGEATWTEYKDRVDFKKLTIAKVNPSVGTEYDLSSYLVSGTLVRSKCIEKLGRVCVDFVLQRSITADTNTTIFNFPSAIIPSTLHVDFPVIANNGNTKILGYGYMNANGELIVNLASNPTASGYIRCSFTYDI